MSDSEGGAGPANPSYVLGHTESELDRLIAQARLIDPITRGFLRDAGIVAGMRILDVGTGAGDVAFLAAEMVGDGGEVVGVDRGAAGLAAARKRANDRLLDNVVFHEGDPAEMTFERPFDAIIGRYVLQFQQDPGAMLRKLAGHLRPGGVIMFHEIDWGGVGSFPPVPTYDLCCRWSVQTLRLHGTETQMGTRLYSTFLAAGLAAPRMRLETLIAGGPDASTRLQLAADLARTLLPEMERLGVATAADVEIETLVDRMLNEAISTTSVVLGHYQIGAWSRARGSSTGASR